MRQDLKKHVGAIHACSKMSLLERKIANVLLLNAYDDLLEQDEHSIRLRDLANIAGYNSNDDEVLKRAVKKLVKTTVEWNILDEQGSEEWTVSTLLSRATIAKGQGVCRYAYDRELCKKLFHPDIYARINLEVQRRFSSSYALVLYENCARFRRVKTTGWISLVDWRRLFGVGDNQYKQFRDFSKRVLKPAISEVNRESDVYVEAEYRREQRKITQIKFNIFESSNTTKIHALDSATAGDVSPLLDQLQELGVSKAAAAKLILQFDEERIQRNLNYTKDEVMRGRAVKNTGGFLMKAVEDDYGSSPSTFLKAENQRRGDKLQAQIAASAKTRKDDKQAYESSLSLKAAYERLSKAEQVKLVEAVLLELEPDDIAQREYQRKGVKSILFMGCVYKKLKDTSV